MNIAVCITSRGYIYTKVIESVLENLRGLNFELFASSDLPIPDCMNSVTDRALASQPDFIWYVEEDTVPPNCLTEMIKKDVDYIAVDYPVYTGHSCFGYYNGELYWTGFGCTLVKPKIFDLFKRPYFRSDMSLKMEEENGKTIFTPTKFPSIYGGHDIYFGWTLREAGVVLTPFRGECEHLRIAEQGKGKVNDGCHLIYAKEEIKDKWYQ